MSKEPHKLKKNNLQIRPKLVVTINITRCLSPFSVSGILLGHWEKHREIAAKDIIKAKEKINPQVPLKYVQ